MTTSAVVPNRPQPPALRSALNYAADSLAPSTLRAYRAAMAAFVDWAADEGLCANPASPQTIAAFLAAEADAGRAVATLVGRLWWHRI